MLHDRSNTSKQRYIATLLFCFTETAIRLTDGDSEGSGRVEIYLRGNWGTVSDKGFDNHDLKVVCRMLGFETT